MSESPNNLKTPKIAFIMDAGTVEGVNPGYVLRVKTLRAWLSTRGFVEELVLAKAGAGRFGRVIQVVRAFFMGRTLSKNYDLVVINGLGGPHMTALAWILSHSCPVILDVCDSVFLTIRAQSRRGQFFRSISSRIKAIFLTRSRRRIGVTYISKRDLEADAVFNQGRASNIIGPQAPIGLDKLEDFVGPASRVVIAADLNSYHNRTAFEWFMEMMDGRVSSPSLRVDLYGPLPPGDLKLNSSITYRGWAPRLTSVYEGQTAVFAPNISGLGVQNKVWEAVWAGRPVLVGAEAAGSLAESPWVQTFRTKKDLETAFLQLAQYRAPAGIQRGVATTAWPALSTALGAKLPSA